MSLPDVTVPLGSVVMSVGLGGSIGVFAAALALGIRHGIDWDHIAAITDITSTTAAQDSDDRWLTREPGVMLTDESHHSLAAKPAGNPAGASAVAEARQAIREAEHIAVAAGGGGTPSPSPGAPPPPPPLPAP